MGSVRDIAPEWLSFYRASDWGVHWKRPPVAEGLNDPETYIHHGAGGRFGTDPQRAMRSLQTWYHDVKNYSTIAYDIMVHRNTDDDTVAILGAREGWLSAATSDRNDIGEAICLFGYFHPGHKLSEHPTPRELEALAYAVAWSIENNWSARWTELLGHRDNPAHPGASTCPGDYLYPHIPSIRRRAFDLINLANKPQEPQMPVLPKPKRVYDSRKKGGPFGPNETRIVNVGTGISEAFVNVTCVSLDKTSGFLSANDPVRPTTSILNYSGVDNIEGNCVPVACEDGKFTITNSHGYTHVIVDLMVVK